MPIYFIICYMIHDNTIKTCFIVLKQVEISAGLSMLRIPQLDLQQNQAISSYGNMYTIQSRRPKTKKLWKSHKYKFYKNIETTPKSSK
jgi:hypothetical protein